MAKAKKEPKPTAEMKHPATMNKEGKVRHDKRGFAETDLEKLRYFGVTGREARKIIAQVRAQEKTEKPEQKADPARKEQEKIRSDKAYLTLMGITDAKGYPLNIKPPRKK